MATTPPPERPCGECSLCCKLPSIAVMNKPENQWCHFCHIGKGCGIYEDRPQTCKDFACAWKLGVLPEEMRPDKTHCLVYFSSVPGSDKEAIACTVDPHRPNAWKTNEMFGVLKRLSEKVMPVVVICGTDRFLMKDRTIQHAKFSGASNAG